MRSDAPWLQVPHPNPTIPSGAWKADLGAHPCLFGPARHLQELARRWPKQYRELNRRPDRAWDESVQGRPTWLDRLPVAGVVRAIEGRIDPARARRFIDLALVHTRAGPSNIHQESWVHLQQAAMAYDFFFDQVTPPERTHLIDWMNAHLGVFTDDENPFHNSTLSKITCYLEIAYATWGENPRAFEFRDYALKRLYESTVLPVIREFGEGGGFTECGWYCRHSLLHLARALELARRFEGYDGYQLAPEFFYHRLALELLQPYPGLWKDGCERYACEGDGKTRYSPAMESPRQLRNILADYFRGSALGRLVDGAARRGGSDYTGLYDFIYRHEAQEPLDIGPFPPAHCAPGIGRAYARSHWGDDASWLRFECGDYFNQHQHFEAGNFEIFRHEPLATESGEYCDWDGAHSLNWLIRTIAHNCILIHQDTEVFDHLNRNRNRIAMANDGGQGARSFICRTLAEWKQKADQGLRRGKIVAYQNQPQCMYVAGDATQAYGAKAVLVLRQIVFLRPHTFVILDRVVATQPQFTKAWLLHCPADPIIEGPVCRIANGRGHLRVQTLLPDPCTIEKVHGYNYGRQTYDPPDSIPEELKALWRIEVHPAAASKEDLFLHVLCTEDSPQPARLLRDGNQIGAAGDGEAGPWQVLFDTPGIGGGTVTVSGQSIKLDNAVQRGGDR